jgi:hypothetical protein
LLAMFESNVIVEGRLISGEGASSSSLHKRINQ